MIGVVAWLLLRPTTDDPTPPPDDRPATIKVENVKGLTVEEAKAKLKGLRVRVKEVSALRPNRRIGRVVAQDPEEGAVLKRGGVITITVQVLRKGRPK